MESELSKVQEMIEHAETELKEVEKAPDQPEEVSVYILLSILLLSYYPPFTRLLYFGLFLLTRLVKHASYFTYNLAAND